MDMDTIVISSDSESDVDQSSENSLEIARETFKCTKCDETFRYRAMLDRHMWTHMNENFKQNRFINNLLQCDYCDKVVPFKLMNCHVRQIHFHETFYCSACNIYNLSPMQYREHIASHREGDVRRKSCKGCMEISEAYKDDRKANYFCDYCVLERPLLNMGQLKNYKQCNVFFRCHLCHLLIKHMSALKRHIARHKTPKFPCPHCKKCFVHIKQYEDHVIGHALRKMTGREK